MVKLRTKQEFRESMRKIGQDLSDAYGKIAAALYSKPEVEEENKKEEKEEKEENIDGIEVNSEEENEKKKRHHSGIARMHSRYDIRQKGGLI